MTFTRSFFAIGVATLFAAGSAKALYTGCDHYNASNFFSEFSFFKGTDPTGDCVSYQSAVQANLSSLAGYSNQSIFLGVDYRTMNPPAPGRGSVRVTSNKAYTQGLFIANIKHMPGSICGIDILEGVNRNAKNTVTLHTSDGCKMTGTGALPTSNLTNSNCGVGGGNDGCSTTTANDQGYGDGFNAIGGGVYAMQWTSNSILVWFFPRNAIPTDITAADKNTSPDVSLWGIPVAAFSGPGCDIDEHFKNHNIVFDTTFCGQRAGKVWENSTCSALAPTCNQYVAENPSAFTEAYWLINSVKVYQDYEAAGTSQSNQSATK